MLGSVQFARQWEHLSELFPKKELLQLAEALFDAEMDLPPERRRGFENESHIVVWRKMYHSVRDESCLRSWLPRQIRRSIGRCIRLADDIYYYWASKRQIQSLMSTTVAAEIRAEARREMVEGANQEFANCAPEKLATALQSGDRHPHYELYHLIFPADGSSESGVSPLRGPEHFRALGPALIAAMQINPEIVVPQVIRVIGTTKELSFGVSLLDTLNSAHLAELFGELARDVVQLIRQKSDVLGEKGTYPTDRTIAVCDEWLSANATSPTNERQESEMVDSIGT